MYEEMEHILFILENPTKMNDLGIPPFMETSICAMVNRWIIHQFGVINPFIENHIPDQFGIETHGDLGITMDHPF